MAKRKARKITIRHPSQRQLVGTPPPYVRKKGPGEPLPVEEVIVDGKVVEKAPVKKVKTTPIAKPKPVKMESPSKKWYTGDDAKKVQNYALGLIEIKKGTNEFSRLDVNNDGKLTITDAMFVAQYVEDKVPRGPSGYSLNDANLVAKHMAGLIELPPELIAKFDANNDGKISISDAMVIKQAVKNETTPVPTPPLEPTPIIRKVGGYSWRLLENPDTGEKGWISRGIGTQYRYGGKEWDERYKGWTVLEDIGEVNPPKGAEYLPSGTPTSASVLGEGVLVKPETKPSPEPEGIITPMERRRQEWLKTLLPGDTKTMPAKGTAWYNYIREGTELPTGMVEMPINEEEYPTGYIPPMQLVKKPTPLMSKLYNEAHPDKGLRTSIEVWDWYHDVYLAEKAKVLAPTSKTTPEPGIGSETHPFYDSELKGGGGWRLIRNPQTQEEGWIQYGIGTQYKYGGKSWDGMYKDWKVVKEGRELKPPKDAELLYSGYNPPKTGYIPPLHKPGEPGITAGGYSSAPRTTKTTKKQVVKKKAKRTTARISSIGR